MAPLAEDHTCAICCHLSVAEAILHPERVDIDNSESIDLKPTPRCDYSEAAVEGCRYCTIILSCLAAIAGGDTRKIGLRLASGCPPIITDRVGSPLRTIYRVLSSDTSWEEIPFRSSITVAGIDRATTWIEARLKECCTSHRLCEKVTTVGPKRLLRLGPENHVRIVDTPRQMPKFVALSYCWGGDQESKLMRNTVDAFRDALPWNRLTVLHKDIITLCRNLGLDYLWIDALCIIQDDRDDWVDQAAVMADIYENAHLTISATCCPNPRQNLFGRGDSTYGGKEKVLERSDDGVPILASRDVIEVGHHREFYENVEEDLLETRGWCFQESRLSRRMVSFTSKELQWQCRESRKCECGDPATEDMGKMLLYKGMKPMKRLKAYRLWGRLLQRYSRTKLTNAEDRLVALAGLASRVALFTESTYVAGLWRDNLAASLLWKSKSAIRPFSTEYRAPTFSWASVDSPVEMVQDLEDAAAGDWTPSVEVIEANAILKSRSSPFGEVIDGFMRLKGITSAAELKYLRSGKMTIALEGLGNSRGISVLLDGRITHATTFNNVPTASRLRSAPSSKKCLGSSSTVSSVVSDDESSLPDNEEKDDENDEDKDDDEDEDDDIEESDEEDSFDDDDNDENDEESDENSNDEIDEDEDPSDSDNSDDELSGFSTSDQGSSLAPFKVDLLHLGFLSIETYTSYCLILGRSPTQQDCYERLGLMKWKHKSGAHDPVVKELRKLPKQEVVVV